MNTQRTTPCPECGEQWASEGSHYRICEVCREDYEPMRLALLSQVALRGSEVAYDQLASIFSKAEDSVRKQLEKDREVKP